MVFYTFKSLLNLKNDEHYRGKIRLFLLVFGFGHLHCPFAIQPFLVFQQLTKTLLPSYGAKQPKVGNCSISNAEPVEKSVQVVTLDVSQSERFWLKTEAFLNISRISVT